MRELSEGGIESECRFSVRTELGALGLSHSHAR
jgi:hypothetical protein